MVQPWFKQREQGTDCAVLLLFVLYRPQWNIFHSVWQQNSQAASVVRAKVIRTCLKWVASFKGPSWLKLVILIWLYLFIISPRHTWLDMFDWTVFLWTADRSAHWRPSETIYHADNSLSNQICEPWQNKITRWHKGNKCVISWPDKSVKNKSFKKRKNDAKCILWIQWVMQVEDFSQYYSIEMILPATYDLFMCMCYCDTVIGSVSFQLCL